MGAQRQSTIRLLAPASLALFAVVFLIVIVASVGGGDDEPASSSEQPAAAREQRSDRARGQAPSAQQEGPGPRFYVVKPGDNLAAIAVETGVPLEELRTLNPELDPQGLVSGQRVRLRRSSE